MQALLIAAFLFQALKSTPKKYPHALNAAPVLYEVNTEHLAATIADLTGWLIAPQLLAFC